MRIFNTNHNSTFAIASATEKERLCFPPIYVYTKEYFVLLILYWKVRVSQNLYYSS